MNIKTRVEQNALIVTVFGELDLVIAEQFKAVIEKELENLKINTLILDLKEVTFIDSSGLGAILSRYKMLSEKHGRMALINPQPAVKRILELSGILRIINIYEDLNRALAAI
ncbi:MAG: anti-sigma F factor antagonist [Zhaonellaceae bacterium]|jgi:stage II sporulation protein AA (anti-sigma F factor antagonist)|nr:anti-sigma F factor antagonist [Clostridia bacterium]